MSGGWERARDGLPVRRLDALVPCLARGCGYSAYIRRIFRHLHADIPCALRTAGLTGARAFPGMSREATSDGRAHGRGWTIWSLFGGVVVSFHSGSMKLSQ